MRPKWWVREPCSHDRFRYGYVSRAFWGKRGLIAPSAQVIRRIFVVNLGSRQRAGLPLDFADRFRDLVHVFARAEHHGLREPDGLLAKLIINGAMVALRPCIKLAGRINRAIGARIEGVFE